MADTVPLSEFRTRVRYKADVEVGASSSRFPDAELDVYINTALKLLYAKLVRARGEDYYQKNSGIICVAGTGSYNLPADFWQMVGVIGYDGTSEYTQLDPFGMDDYPDLVSGNQNAGSVPEMRYKLWPSTIELCPPPNSASWRVYLNYVPAPTELSLATDTFDGISGFEEWAVLTAAIAVKTKDEEDPSALMAERAMQDQLIESLAAQRDAGRPATIQDTRRDHIPSQWTHAGLRDDWNW